VTSTVAVTMRWLASNVIAAAGTGASADRIGGTKPAAAASANNPAVARVAYHIRSIRLA
jgi:hypothetical protein